MIYGRCSTTARSEIYGGGGGCLQARSSHRIDAKDLADRAVNIARGFDVMLAAATDEFLTIGCRQCSILAEGGARGLAPDNRHAA
ncbi:hypothetical protein MTOK_46250 [Mycolicibacterium tokaiense]|nr:hypothetical protein MTOK_46250 [Mycolicibacterium tokaiense]